MSKIAVSPSTQLQILEETRAYVSDSCPHPVKNLSFVQQSHNAVVVRGEMLNETAFIKVYSPQARRLARASVAEAARVAPCFARQEAAGLGGIAPLVWADAQAGVVAARRCRARGLR